MKDTRQVASSGELLDGRYFVFERLEGGHGHVYLCYDTASGTFQALKALRTVSHNTSALQERFLREIELWVQLPPHDAVVRCEDARLIGETPFAFVQWVMPMALEMELSVIILRTICSEAVLGRGGQWDPEGVLTRAWQPKRLQALDLCRDELLAHYRQHRPQRVTLEDWLSLGAPSRVDAQVAVGWVVDVCQALVDCRTVQPGLAHRDIHTRNVLITEERRAMLTDFGIANVVAPVEKSAEATTHEDVRALCYLLEHVARKSDYEACGFDAAVKLLDQASALSRRCGKPGEIQTPEQLLSALQRLYAEVFGAPPPRAKAYDFTGFDYAQIGGVYTHILDRPEIARTLFEKAVTADPVNLKAHYELGVQLLQANEPDKAVAYLEHAYLWLSDDDWQNGHGASVLTALARAYVVKRRFADALACLDRALQIRPNDAQSHAVRGQALASLGETAAGLRSFERALDINPDQHDARLFRAALLADAGDLTNAVEEARDVLRRLEGRSDAPSSELRQIASTLLRELETAMQTPPGSARTWVLVLPDPTSGDPPLYCLQRQTSNWTRFSLAMEDGSFTDPAPLWRLPGSYVLFRSADDAIAWAEQPPRCWRVVNKYEVMSDPPRLPHQVTVRIKKAAHHALKSDELGQPVCHVHFKLLAHSPADRPLPEDIRSAMFFLDESAQAQLQRIGCTKWSQLSGVVMKLQIEDEQDYKRPWRMRCVIYPEPALDWQTVAERLQKLIVAGQFQHAEHELDQWIGSVDRNAVVIQHGIKALATSYVAIANVMLAQREGEPSDDERESLQQAERCLEKAWQLFGVPISRPMDVPEMSPLVHTTLYQLGWVKRRLGKRSECLRCWRALLQLPPIDANSARQQDEVSKLVTAWDEH